MKNIFHVSEAEKLKSASPAHNCSGTSRILASHLNTNYIEL